MDSYKYFCCVCDGIKKFVTNWCLSSISHKFFFVVGCSSSCQMKKYKNNGLVNWLCNHCIRSSFQATGDMNNLIMIWEAETCKHLYKFTGHKGAVSVRALPPSVGPAMTSPPHQTHALLFCRASPSGRALTTSTARPTTAPSRCGTWMKTPTWKPCRYLWIDLPARWNLADSHRASPQLRPPGRHHRPGLPEPRALRDGRRAGPLSEGVEDRRGVAAGVPRPRVSPFRR